MATNKLCNHIHSGHNQRKYKEVCDRDAITYVAPRISNLEPSAILKAEFLTRTHMSFLFGHITTHRLLAALQPLAVSCV